MGAIVTIISIFVLCALFGGAIVDFFARSSDLSFWVVSLVLSAELLVGLSVQSFFLPEYLVLALVLLSDLLFI